MVGPEAPLVAGIQDFLKNDADCKNVIVIGPSSEGAKLEGSKSFAKEFMQEFGIPTAQYQSFTKEKINEGLAFLASMPGPYVLKADGLAAGKGVIILSSLEEAKESFKNMLNGQFGDASKTVVIEEFLDGIEFSVFVLTDGSEYIILPEAKDYKRIGEGDTGLNTGGMGSISPVSFVNEKLRQQVEETIIKPTIKGIQSRGIDYTGFIFFGLICVGNTPYVIEYNCRMGDPETEVVIPRIKSDLVNILSSAGTHQISKLQLEVNSSHACCVMLVSGGYPEAYAKGKQISGHENKIDSLLFHAGTKIKDNNLLTNGGRVMAVCSFGNNMADALETSYKNSEQIEFEGKYLRSDIGFDL